jgi:hypothetical protein
MASAPRTEITCSTSTSGDGVTRKLAALYRANAWYSSLGIMPHASDMRFVKLYMLAISITTP